MSILRSKHSGWGPDGRRTPFTGGGGGGQPSQTTTYSTNIPEYARPYVENMLESTQKQIYNEDMTGFKPYKPFSADVNKYFAGFQPLQEQAMRATGQLQTPGQFGTATGLAGSAGMGGLGAAQQAGALGGQALGYGATGAEYGGMGAQQALARAQQTAQQAGMYGGMGAGYGGMGVQAAQQGFGAGEAFARQATDPYATQAYMSPYMQNVVDYQKSQALRDYNIGRPMRQAQAVGKGAFGGSRQAIAEAEAERGLMSQLQGITATGSQKAFEDAQRQQQFGANLGLQGLQAGYGGLGLGMQGAGLGLQGVGAQQAAGQLGLAGTAQGIQGAQAGLSGVGQAIGAGQYGLQGLGQATQAAGALGQLGQQQFGAQKDIINLQSQMGKEQQALEQSKINQQIQDYAISQQYPFMQLGMMNAMLRGLPMQTQSTQLYQAQPSMLQQGIGLAGAGASLFGGRAAGGAIKEYREGGIADSYKYGGAISNPELETMANKLSAEQLKERLKDPQITPGERQIFSEALNDKSKDKARYTGIAAAGGGLFDTMGYAGGGILAFSEGGDPEERARKQLEEDRAALLSGGKSFGSSAMDVLTLPNRAIAGVLNTGIRGARAVTGANIPYIYGDDPSMTESLTPYYDKNVRKPALQKAAAEKEQKDLDQFDEATRRFEEERAAKKTLTAKAKEEGAGTEGRSDRSGVVTGPKTLADFFKQQKELGPKGQVGEGFEKFIDEYTGDKDRLSRKERAAMAKGFLEFASTAGPIGVAAAKGLGTYATGAEAARDAEDKIKFESAKIKGDLDKARRAEQRGDVEGAQKAYESAANRDNQIKVAQMQLSRGSDFERQYEAFKNDPAKFKQFRESLTSSDDTARLNAYVKADTFISQAYPQLMFSKKPEDIQRLEQLRNAKVAEYLGAIGMASQGAPAGSGAKGQVDTNNALLRT